MKKSIVDLTTIIRSKNSGPYELTLDMMFVSEAVYRYIRDHQLISAEMISALYHITPEQIINIIYFDPANAIKATIVRPLCSGDLGETDVYGAQQHAPLLQIELDLPNELIK